MAQLFTDMDGNSSTSFLYSITSRDIYPTNTIIRNRSTFTL